MYEAPSVSLPTPDEVVQAVEAALARHGADPSRLLVHLLGLQDALRCVPRAAQQLLAARLGLPPARVEALVHFYAFLSETPRGAFDLLLGTCVTDEFNGADALCAALAEALHVAPGSTRADGRVSLGRASCTGLCDQPVAALLNGLPLAGLRPEHAGRIAALIEQGVAPDDWPAEFKARPSTVRRPDQMLGRTFAPGAALSRARATGVEGLLADLTEAGLRGRGGAGYRTGLKWRQCREAVQEGRGRAVVVCNADEGEPGTFKDRWLLEHAAERLVEGMSLAAFALGGAEGFVYLRAEYRYLLPALEAVLEARRAAGLLGPRAGQRLGVDFDIEIRLGAGAYVCGEESALIESLEGKRGIPRNRPPYPVTHGYLGRPTVVNNVETFILAADIAAEGPARFAALGTPASRGTKLLSVSGDCARPGLYEYPFGVSVAQVLADCGAAEARAVQVGGPSGVLVGQAEFGKRLAYEALSTGGAFMVLGPGREPLDLVRNHTRFFAHESCGFCTPCRVGGTLLAELLDKVHRGHGTSQDLKELERLAREINATSHCGLGQTCGNPVLDSLGRFREHYLPRLTASFSPGFDLDGALAEARRLTGRDDARAHLEN